MKWTYCVIVIFKKAHPKEQGVLRCAQCIKVFMRVINRYMVMNFTFKFLMRGHIFPQQPLGQISLVLLVQGDLSFLPPPKKTESQTWGEGKKQSPRTPPMSGT